MAEDGCGGFDLAAAHGYAVVAQAMAANEAAARPGAIADEVDTARHGRDG